MATQNLEQAFNDLISLLEEKRKETGSFEYATCKLLALKVLDKYQDENSEPSAYSEEDIYGYPQWLIEKGYFNYKSFDESMRKTVFTEYLKTLRPFTPSQMDRLIDDVAGIMYANKTDEADDGSWIESKDFHKVAEKIVDQLATTPPPPKATTVAKIIDDLKANAAGCIVSLQEPGLKAAEKAHHSAVKMVCDDIVKQLTPLLATTVTQEQDAEFFKWLDEKPVFNFECLVIAANEFRGGWHYMAFRIEKVDSEEGWYWGWLDGDGEEYGDLSDFDAEKYFLMPLLKQAPNDELSVATDDAQGGDAGNQKTPPPVRCEQQEGEVSQDEILNQSRGNQ
jgi:hypothetical protein